MSSRISPFAACSKFTGVTASPSDMTSHAPSSDTAHPAAATPAHQLLFLPLGGAGEIGMNLNLYGYGGKWLMVDLGITFVGEELPGIDVVMPDPAFIVERRDDLLGLVLTHAHEDHLGAVADLWDQLRCPVYASPFAAEILRGKLAEANLLDAVPLTEVPCGGSLALGPFEVRFISVTHSIPESNALAITTPAGTVLHTGDFKLDPEPMLGPVTDREALRHLGDQGILAVIGDSTNVFEPGSSGSEASVRQSLMELVGEIEGQVALTTFASHVARISTAAAVAEAHQRHIALVGRSMRRTVAAARAVGYLNGAASFMTEAEAAHLPRDKVLWLCTGSQGEPRGAMARIASGEHPHVTLGPGDAVIFSSKQIPGNERALGAVHNRLVAAGVRVLTEKGHFVHVSGHPNRDELAEMYRWLRPRIAVPVHGEARHLAEHAAFASSLQVPETIVVENGAMVRLAPGPAALVDWVRAGRLVREGNSLVSPDDPVFRARRSLAKAGLLVATLVLDAEGLLLVEPRLVASGVIAADDAGPTWQLRVREAVERAEAPVRRDDEALKRLVKRVLRQGPARAGGRGPLVDVEIVRLPRAAGGLE